MKTIVFKNNLSQSAYNNEINNGKIFGFITVKDGNLAIPNRIFETALIYHFITKENIQNLHGDDLNDRSKYFKGNELDMEYILNRFIFHFNQIYGDDIKEDYGRKIFMKYLRPIINGIGNFFIEAQTDDGKRVDLIVDIIGKQYLIELNINNGDVYNDKGIQQHINYLDKFDLDVGYLLIFNFNKKKKIGVSKMKIGSKTIIKAII